MSQRGVWCGYQDVWTDGYSIITYDDLFFNSSVNMNDPGVGYGLDIDSGKNSFKTVNIESGQYEILEGVFTVPQTGEWRVSFSLGSVVGASNDDKSNSVCIVQNFKGFTECWYETNVHGKYYGGITTGGRELVLRAVKGDTLSLRAFVVDNSLSSIITCFEFLSP